MNGRGTGPLFLDYDTYHMLDSLAVECLTTVVFHLFLERSFPEDKEDRGAVTFGTTKISLT